MKDLQQKRVILKSAQTESDDNDDDNGDNNNNDNNKIIITIIIGVQFNKIYSKKRNEVKICPSFCHRAFLELLEKLVTKDVTDLLYVLSLNIIHSFIYSLPARDPPFD